MPPRLRPHAVLAALAAALCAPVSAAGQEHRPPPPPGPGGGPLPVAVGILLGQVNKVDEAAQTSFVEGYMELRWRDPRQAFSAATEGNTHRLWEDDAAREVLGKTVWWPDPELVDAEDGGTLDRFYLRTDTAGGVYFSARFHATVLTPLDLRRFPYDHQALRVSLEPHSAGVGAVRFVPDTAASGVGHRIALAEWEVTGFRAHADVDDYTALGEMWDRYSMYVFELHVARRYGYYHWKVLLPLALIVASGWTVFWFRELATQLSVAFTVMLTVVAFHFAVSGALPRVPYLTFMDALLLAAYLSVFLSLLAVVAAHALERGGHEERVLRLERAARWAFPLGLVLVVALLALVFL